MNRTILIINLIITTFLFSCSTKNVTIDGELKKWHTIILTFEGPELDESGIPNPFLDYRLQVEFSNGDTKYNVPGFFAADGNASETGASSGTVWQVRFVPDKIGEWTYNASFRTGKEIAVSDLSEDGEPIAFDGATGKFTVEGSDKTGRDFRSKGRLKYIGKRYLQFSETKEFFLKGGADSPENFLAFKDFDGTEDFIENEAREGEAAPPPTLHEYTPHLNDWKGGDPTWRGGKGKAIIGALNYLASEGMNSVYFLTMNIGGDGKDVWPYSSYNERFRFDCSKLDQWEIVFSYMDKLGLMLHIVTQETENEMLLDNGNTEIQRKLYYRELIARFAHHLAITWNMGEENGPADFSPNGQNTGQQKAMTDYFKLHDPYRNFVVIHTHANPEYRYRIFNGLLGHPTLDGPSIQIGNPLSAHKETKTWIHKSDSANHPWVVCIDEIGHASRGLDPDDKSPFNNQDSIRSYVLWANLMAGGAGAEWYFGYKNHNNDLGCEDWRSRDKFWDYTRIALEFFNNHLPFSEMVSKDELLFGNEGFVFTIPGEVYAIYLPQGGEAKLDLSDNDGEFDVSWYNPRSGGELVKSSVSIIKGGGIVPLGNPPYDAGKDWTVLLRKN